VIHGDYTRWVNEGTLHSVTNYHLHKALYSGHNDHNYFEIAHTVKRLYDMGGNQPEGLKLYNFVDNHDVERIYTKLTKKAHYTPVQILLYTLPGIPSIYYGSEFGIEVKKEKFSDDSLRPALNYEDYKDATATNPCTQLIARLGEIRKATPALSYGNYEQLMLTNRQYAFIRNCHKGHAIVTVNNDDSDFVMSLSAPGTTYIGLLSGEKVSSPDGNLVVNVKANGGDIWVPDTDIEVEIPITTEPIQESVTEPVTEEPIQEGSAEAVTEEPMAEQELAAEAAMSTEVEPCISDDFRNGVIAGLQEAVLARMEMNGPVTEQMKNDVYGQTDHDSLINWIKSFR
ncbi:MAG: alpha-amylase, partial [Eubacterium sp.]|nr:alpha-amylase [Eubacterium sp.]